MFLGLLNFDHAFLPQKASLAEPLHRLLEKKLPWVWSWKHNQASSAVKELLLSDSMLTHYDELKPLVLTSDALPHGISMVMNSQMPDGWEIPTAYFSTTLSSVEWNYAQTDKEALSLVTGVKKFYDYVY